MAERALAVIVVNYRTPDLAIECLDALAGERGDFPDLEVVMVDGGSGDGSAEAIGDAIVARGFGAWARLLALPVNGGFAYANNCALAGVRARYVALVNPDARVLPGALKALADVLDAQPRVAAAGGLLVHEDGRPQGSAFRFPTIRTEFSRGAQTGVIDRLLGLSRPVTEGEAAQPAPWVTGAAMMFRRDALAEVGAFDDGFFLYFEETELMHRLRRAGWDIWHVPAARVVHHGGVATQVRDPETGRPLRKRMPRYWYEARLRYFALTGGRAYALAAGLAWLAGRALWKGRAVLTRRADEGPEGETGDTMRFSFWPGAGQATPARVRIDDAPADRPAWMRDKR